MSDDIHDEIELPEDDTLTYGTYLKVDEMLELQQLRSEPPMHDELLFITIHQAYELWFKQVLFELDTIIERLDMGDIYEARRLLGRVIKIEKLLVQQIHILETMMPRDFASFRSILNPASGFQSVQFRELEFVSGIKDDRVMRGIRLTDSERERLEERLEAPSLRDAFYAMLIARGFDVASPCDDPFDEEERARTVAALREIYDSPERNFHVYSLCEVLLDHDQALLLWRFHHVRVVERLIGTKRGTGGSPGVRYLNTTLAKRAFPILWEVRGLLRDDEHYGRERGPTWE